MSTLSPINGLPIPDEDSPNAPWMHFQAFADVLDSRLVSPHASDAARDTAITAPQDGQIIYNQGDDHYYERIAGAWVKRIFAKGLISYGALAASASSSGTAETRLAGAHNRSGLTLVAGRAYEAVAKGNANIDGGAGIVILNLRARKGATPTVSVPVSPIVATAQVYCTGTGGGGQAGYNTAGQPFQVTDSGSDWQIHLFGKVHTGGTSMDAAVDGRGVHSIAVYDMGAATADVPTI